MEDVDVTKVFWDCVNAMSRCDVGDLDEFRRSKEFRELSKCISVAESRGSWLLVSDTNGSCSSFADINELFLGMTGHSPDVARCVDIIHSWCSVQELCADLDQTHIEDNIN